MNYSKLVLTLAIMIAAPAFAADVGVSLSIGQPGFYGQIDIGNYSRPPVINARPVVIQRIPRGEVREPLYLRVPRGHARNWRRYCSRYDACGRPVYFVKDDWYSNVYAPRYRDEHRDDRRNDGRDSGRDDRHDRPGNDYDRNDGRDRNDNRRDHGDH
jgi:hypothetical protein